MLAASVLRLLQRKAALAGCVAAALAASLAPERAAAQSKYPDRSIRMVVPFAAGGATDIIARAISQPLGEVLGQSVIVENRPGAGSNLGAGVVAKWDPLESTCRHASLSIL